MEATEERRAAPVVGPRLGASSAASGPARLHAIGRRELLLAWALLALLGALAYAPHVRGGGFHLDDWSNGAGSLYPPGGGGFVGVLGYFHRLALYRPVLLVYVPLTFELFGAHAGWQLAWAAAMAIAASGVLFAILRTVGLARVDAWLVAALVLVFPWSDATRMWVSGSQVTLGVLLYLAGVWVALVALRRRSIRLHAASLLLFALSVLAYEIALVLIAATGALYVAVACWRAARTRWAADAALAAVAGVWILVHTERTATGDTSDLDHLRQIVTSGGTLLGRTALAVGPQRTTLALVAIGSAVVAAGIAWLPGRGAAAPAGERMWLPLGAAGLAVAACGWAIFIPADPYYTPSLYGMNNRVNGLAGIGLVLILYAVCGVAGALVGRAVRRPLAGRVVTVALALALGGSYLHVLERHSAIWNRAADGEAATLAALQTRYPSLPEKTTVFLSGRAAYETLGVPIFAVSWDASGAIKLQYGNSSLAAYPVVADARIVCAADRAKLVSGGVASASAVYGRVRFLDSATGRSAAPRNAAECHREAPSFTAGPLTRSVTY